MALFGKSLGKLDALYRTSRLVVVILFVAAHLNGVPSIAQVATADMVGTVTDGQDASVPNAKVTITNQATGVTYNATSNDSGEFAVSQLPAGRYTTAITAAGFKGWTLTDIELVGGDRHRITPKLSIGNVDQVITVTGEEPALQTDTSTISSVVNEVQTQNLPLNGRNPVQLAQFTAGATDYTGGSFSPSPDDERRGSGVSVNGRTGAENNYLIDGQDDNERFVNTTIAKPSVEGLSEVRVVSNTPSAELGRASGATIVFVSKGGTNKLHGSLFEFYSNQALSAYPQNTAPNTPKPSHTQNNYGGSIGGAVRRDKLFYFGDFETYSFNTGVTQVSTVPTAAERTGDFSGVTNIYDPNNSQLQFPGNKILASEINAVAQKAVNLYPLPNVPGAGLTNNFSFTSPNVQTDRTVDTRVDYKISPTNALFSRYNYGHTDTLLPYLLPSSNGFYPAGQTTTGQFGGSGSTTLITNSAGVIDTITLSSTNVLILRAGYGRYDNLAIPQDYGDDQATRLGIPGATVDELSTGFPVLSPTGFTTLGSGSHYPTINRQNIFSYGTSLQLLRGKHLIKLGGEFVRRQVSDYQSAIPNVAMTFTSAFTSNGVSTTTTGNAIASFLLGYPATTQRQRYLIRPGYRSLENGWFVQDDYRATRYLTLNAGFRYDYFSPISEQHNRISDFDYPNAKVLVAGQDGVSNRAGVNRDLHDFGPRVGFALQLGTKSNVFGGFGIAYTPGMLGTPGAMRNAPFVSNYNLAPNLFTPINRISDPLPATVPDSINNPIGTFYAVDLNFRLPYIEQFNLTAQRQLPYAVVLSVGYVGALGKRQSGSNNALNLNSASPGPAAVQTRRPLFSLYPNLGPVSQVRNYYTSSYHSLQASLRKNYSNGMTFNINYTWSHAIDSTEVRYYVTDQFSTVKGTSSSDIRNRVSILWVYELPSKHTKLAWVNPIVRGWTLTSIATVETGLPFSVTQTGSQLNGAEGQNRPNLSGSFKVSNPSAKQWFNASAFAAQPNYTFGSEGRNLLNAPGSWDMDLGIHRDFKIKEIGTLEVRAEAFDFTNSRNPNAPISVLGQAGFGTITTYSNNRNMQLAAKFMF